MTTLSPLALPVDDRADLALLVAHPLRPRPFYIDAGNYHAGWPSTVADAIGSGRPYAVTVAPDVLAYDLDTDDAAELADRLADVLALDGCPVLRTASGRDGHRHLFAVVPHPARRARIDARLVALGAPARRQQIRPPGAPHRLGLPVDVLDDVPTFAAAVAAARAADELAHDPARDRLDWRRLLDSGCFPRGWKGEGSGSAAVYFVAMGAIRAGHDLEAVRALLADPRHRGGAPYRDRLDRLRKHHADYWLEHYVWPSAMKAAGRTVTPPADALEARTRLRAIAAASTEARWTGIAGATDRAVLAALVARAQARGSLTPPMSCRELAEAAPCSLRTVYAARDRLAAAGWLQVVDRGHALTELDAEGSRKEQTRGTRWRLLTPARDCTNGGTPPVPRSLVQVRARAELDVCRWGGGLGLNAPRVLDALAVGPLTSRALAGRLGLNEGNLRARLLPRLAAHGLVVRGQDGWTLAADLPAAVAAAADELGLTGKADAVAAGHADERARYLEARELARPARDAARARAHRDAVAARRARGTVPMEAVLDA